MCQFEEYWEVWEKTYDTFGEGEDQVTHIYATEEVAKFHVAILNQMWGTRARYEHVRHMPEVDSETTVESLKESYKWAWDKCKQKIMQEITGNW